MELQEKNTASISDDQLFVSSDSGETWIVHDVTAKWEKFKMSIDGSKLLDASIDGQIYTSKDSGATWSLWF